MKSTLVVHVHAGNIRKHYRSRSIRVEFEEFIGRFLERMLESGIIYFLRLNNFFLGQKEIFDSSNKLLV